jgi:hypothetical protein
MNTTETHLCCIKHMCADNDHNGNPRRVYALIDEEGYYLAAWDEGYRGSDAVPGEWRRAAYHAERARISVREYSRILREVPSPDYAHDVPGYSHLRVESRY